MRLRIGTLVTRLINVGTRPDDPPGIRAQKSVLTLAAAAISVLAIYWVGMYQALGLRASAAIPLTYQILSVGGLIHLGHTKDVRVLRASQLTMMLVLPFVLQWSLGGFVNSSGVMLWAFIAPLGMILIGGLRQAGRWFGAYLGLTLVSGLVDARLSPGAPVIPTWLIVANFVMNIGAVSGVAFFLLRHFAAERQRALEALGVEHARSENLLLNILPKPIAERLKHNPASIAERFPEATVLFADIADFTSLTAAVPPEETAAWLNDLFSLLDALSDRFGLEKIKTVGDSYLAVAGIPVPRSDHAEAAAEMALEIQRALRTRTMPRGEPLRMRIGIHTGPVVAGVIGTRKFIYDLWGDTVNIASRMESHGLPGAIQVTEAIYVRLHDRYVFEGRGVIAVKGKGNLATYLLKGRREHRLSMVPP